MTNKLNSVTRYWICWVNVLKNPGEAFVILQQLSIFIWDQYKIDWSDRGGHKVADSRKQRYIDFISELIDSKMAADTPPEDAS